MHLITCNFNTICISSQVEFHRSWRADGQGWAGQSDTGWRSAGGRDRVHGRPPPAVAALRQEPPADVDEQPASAGRLQGGLRGQEPEGRLRLLLPPQPAAEGARLLRRPRGGYRRGDMEGSQWTQQVKSLRVDRSKLKPVLDRGSQPNSLPIQWLQWDERDGIRNVRRDDS